MFSFHTTTLLSFAISLPLLVISLPQTAFPVCSTSCLDNLFSSSDCSSSLLWNACLCNDVSYLEAVAVCIGENCASSELSTTANIARTNCANNMTPLAMSVDDFVNAGSVSGTGPDPTTTTPSGPTSTGGSAATPTYTPPKSDGGGGGFTKDQKIALGVGIGIGVPTVLIALITLCVTCRRR